jgi:sec-independent protein translocase protein TatA
VVVLFGATRLPQIGKGVGEGHQELQKSVSGDTEIDVTPKKAEKKKRGRGRKEKDCIGEPSPIIDLHR